MINGKEAISDKGELQLTDYGISGIPTFQISRYAVKALDEGKKVIAQIDFMPDLEYEEFKELIKRQMEWFPEKSLEQILIGFLNKKLVPVMIKKAGLANKIVVKKITDKQLDVLLDWIKSFLTEVVSYNSFDQAQVCMGGVDTREISKETLESLRVAGVYFAGEIMDVDGICGGYNLQWAWSSGYVAGQNASKG
ncbi:hypothetical protein CG709_20245 [Lachnotalea glycerini]|nr:hypothetical protein CG709_20245 [Lachnotalea glycerini]